MKIPSLSDFITRKRSAPAKNHPGKASATDTAAPVQAPLHWTQIGLTILTIVLLSALMSVNLIPDRVSLHKGDINRHELRASRTVFYVNTVKTELNQQAARLNVHPVYQRDEHAASNAMRIAQEFFDRLEAERNVVSRRTPSKAAALDQSAAHLQLAYSSLSRAQFQSTLTISPALLQKMRDIAVSRIRMAMMMDIHDKYDQSRPSNDMAHAVEDVADAARTALSSENAAIVTEIARLALRPNLLFDAQKTELAREYAARQVPPVYEQISPGDRIIGASERVTQDHLDKFAALGLLNPHIALETGIGVSILAAAMVLLVVYFIGRTLPKLYSDTPRLMLLAVIVLISVFGLKIGGSLFGLSFSSGQIGYMGMMTVVAAGMLVSVLLDMQLAVLIVALLAVQSGLIMNHEIRFTVMTLMSSLVGIFAVGHVRRTLTCR
jgi:membrane-associated HD superfamily phosphohydrolase